jgi:hypothetical protein
VGDELSVGAEQILVEQTFIHPNFGYSDRHRDLGLIQLARPAPGITPVVLYEADDEDGQRVTFVGDGYHGDGNAGPSPGERILRAAHNTVESVRAGWITFRFDAPPAGDEMEGISGPGDSGGPALIETEAGWAVAGVSAFNEGSPPCTYGSIEHYSRVSDELEWIRGVMDGRVGKSSEPRLMKYGTDEDGQTTVAREPLVVVEIDGGSDDVLWAVVGELTDALNRGDREGYLSLFTEACIARHEAADDPLEGMLEFMAQVHEERGPVASFHPLDAKAIDLEESEYPMRPVTFHLEDGISGYVGLAIDAEGRIDHMSLFVQRSICADGSGCEIATSLEEAQGAD